MQAIAQQLSFGLSNASSNATIGPSGFVHIRDDEPLISISPDVLTITEGNAGTTDAVFTVSLSAPYDEDVTVDFTTWDDGGYYGESAVPGIDYLATAGTVLIRAGETSQTIRVPIIGDHLTELDEYFYVSLDNSSSNAAISFGYSFGIILDDEPPAISIYYVTRSEGNAGMASVTFGVGLSMPSSQTVSVYYATANGSATAGSDYQATSQAARRSLPFLWP